MEIDIFGYITCLSLGIYCLWNALVPILFNAHRVTIGRSPLPVINEYWILLVIMSIALLGMAAYIFWSILALAWSTTFKLMLHGLLLLTT